MGFLLPDGTINAQTKTAGQVLSDEEKNKVEEWKSPLKYIGVDVQYFAALVLPTDDQLKKRTIERSVPMLLERPANKSQTDLSVQLDSAKVVLAAQRVGHAPLRVVRRSETQDSCWLRCRRKPCSISVGSPRSAT